MQRPDTFIPQAGFVLTKAGYFSDFDEKVAVSLYQPLVGPVPMALYLSLWQEVKDRALVTDRRPQHLSAARPVERSISSNGILFM